MSKLKQQQSVNAPAISACAGHADRKKLRSLWAMANRVYGKDKEKIIYSMIFVYKKERIHDLTEQEFDDLLRHMRLYLSDSECPSAPKEWRLIKVLQRQAGWTDEHLSNYIKKHAHVDHPRFLDYYSARAIITGLINIQKKIT